MWPSTEFECDWCRKSLILFRLLSSVRTQTYFWQLKRPPEIRLRSQAICYRDSNTNPYNFSPSESGQPVTASAGVAQCCNIVGFMNLCHTVLFNFHYDTSFRKSKTQRSQRWGRTTPTTATKPIQLLHVLQLVHVLQLLDRLHQLQLLLVPFVFLNVSWKLSYFLLLLKRILFDIHSY